MLFSRVRHLLASLPTWHVRTISVTETCVRFAERFLQRLYYFSLWLCFFWVLLIIRVLWFLLLLLLFQTLFSLWLFVGLFMCLDVCLFQEEGFFLLLSPPPPPLSLVILVTQPSKQKTPSKSQSKGTQRTECKLFLWLVLFSPDWSLLTSSIVGCQKVSLPKMCTLVSPGWVIDVIMIVLNLLCDLIF